MRREDGVRYAYFHTIQGILQQQKSHGLPNSRSYHSTTTSQHMKRPIYRGNPYRTSQYSTTPLRLHNSPLPHSTIIPHLLVSSILKHVQPLMRIAVLPRPILIRHVRAARNTAAVLVTVRCQLGGRDGAAAVVHLSCVEAHFWFCCGFFSGRKKPAWMKAR